MFSWKMAETLMEAFEKESFSWGSSLKNIFVGNVQKVGHDIWQFKERVGSSEFNKFEKFWCLKNHEVTELYNAL